MDTGTKADEPQVIIKKWLKEGERWGVDLTTADYVFVYYYLPNNTNTP